MLSDNKLKKIKLDCALCGVFMVYKRGAFHCSLCKSVFKPSEHSNAQQQLLDRYNAQNKPT